MTSDGEALLAAIIANPAEDTPRLVYADWLDENGQAERAEFIRVQCEITRILSSNVLDSPGGRETYLRGREQGLIRDHGYGWCDSLLGDGWKTNGHDKQIESVWASYRFGTSSTSAFRLQFARGFIELITCEAADWLAHGDEIRKQQPVTRVNLITNFEMNGDDDEVWLVGDPQSRKFAWVDVYNYRLTSGEHAFMNDWQIVPRLRWPGISFQLPA